MNNINTHSQPSQVPQVEFNANPIGFSLNALDKYAISVFSLIYSRCNKYKSFYARQDTIAYLAGGLHRNTVNRKLPVLERLGFIHIHKRGFHKTAEYVIDAFFFTAPGRIILIIIFHISFLYVTPPGSGAQLNINNVTTTKSAPQYRAEGGVKSFYKKETGYAISTPSTVCKPAVFVTPLFFEVAPEFYNMSEYAFNMGSGRTAKRNPVPDIFYKKRVTKTKKDNIKRVIMNIPFSEIQTDLINMQPKEVFELSMQTYEKHASMGIVIKNPASYFMTLFNKQSALIKQNIKNTHQSYNKPKAKAKDPVEWNETDEDTRDMLLDRKARIIQRAHDKGIQTDGYTLGEIELLIRGYKVIPLNGGIPIKIDTQAVHTLPRSWNEMIMPTGDAQTYVSDNSADYMSNDFPVDASYEFGSGFQEVFD